MSEGEIRLKSPDDIKRIREAGIILSDMFRSLSNADLKGLSTWELDTYIDEFITRRKGRAAFKTLPHYNYASCISINNEAAHGVPSEKRIIHNGDIVKIDAGIVLNGFFCDSCVTLPAGTISEKAQKLIEISGESLMMGIKKMYAGARLGDMGSEIQKYTEKKGCSIVKKYAGHGTGFALHEAPSVPHFGRKGTGILLKEGLVIAIEPIINEGSSEVIRNRKSGIIYTADGKLSAQFEHTVAVTKEGPLILTI